MTFTELKKGGIDELKCNENAFQCFQAMCFQARLLTSVYA